MDRQNPRIAVDLILSVDGQDVSVFRPQLRKPALARHLKWPDDAIGLVSFEVPLPARVSDGAHHEVGIRFARTRQLLHQGHCTAQALKTRTPLSEYVSLSEAPGGANVGMFKPQVTVVVLNRNGAAVLEPLLTSWLTHNRRIQTEWIVIDHASTDKSLALLREWQSRLSIRIKSLKVNQSFSASCNLGARLAKTPYLLFLNNDLVWQHDALPQMLETLQEADVCVVGMKLVKTGQDGGAGTSNDVQHLGVRCTLHHKAYLPYELDPLNGPEEPAFRPLEVPAVTGTALLCSKKDFDSVGGFNEEFFYGFEDVELCLRAAHRLNKRVVCRNDLVALHRHGHTRLTGREPSVVQRLQHNETVFQRHVGLWLKRAWWRSLLTADRGLCAESFTVGLWPGKAGWTKHRPAILELGLAIQKLLPSARVELMFNATDAQDARGLHLLVVCDPSLDPRRIENARADLRCVAWMLNTVESWIKIEHGNIFHAHWARTANLARAFHKRTGWAVEVPSPADPIPGLQRGRILLLPAVRSSAAQRAVMGLHQKLKCAGWVVGVMTDDQPAALRMWDAKLYVGGPETKDELDPACWNGWWRLSPKDRESPQKAWDWAARIEPTPEKIEQWLEERIGRTFYSP